jgi:hypothetical protein
MFFLVNHHDFLGCCCPESSMACLHGPTGFPIAMSDYPTVDFSVDELNPMNIPFHILGKL